MKYFRLIQRGVPLSPLLEEIERNGHFWLADISREKIPVQRNTNTILLRSAPQRKDLPINENQTSRVTSIAGSFPKALEFMAGCASDMQSQLCRAIVVRLKPRSQVFSHVDYGSYYKIRNRFHLVLKSPGGSILKSGDEEVSMAEGELWWFDNKQYHESHNNSDDWRIHYIFDLLPDWLAEFAVNPEPPLSPTD